MQSVSSRIWTRVAVSISCNDNQYTTGTSSVVVPVRVSAMDQIDLFTNHSYLVELIAHTKKKNI